MVVHADTFETERDMKRTGRTGSAQPLRTSDLGAELRRRFSFTRSEASVALLITEGLTYAEIAQRLGVSYHTVHTHVKAIHAKARVSSNGRLLALIRSVEGA